MTAGARPTMTLEWLTAMFLCPQCWEKCSSLHDVLAAKFTTCDRVPDCVSIYPAALHGSAALCELDAACLCPRRLGTGHGLVICRHFYRARFVTGV